VDPRWRGEGIVGFFTQFPTVCCYLLIAYLDSGFSCGYFFSFINGWSLNSVNCLLM